MRHLLSPLDLSVDELARLLDLARDISKDPSKYGHVCDGKKIATLFYEPSTRTRLSFEEFLSCDKIFCCGGSWMVKGDMIKAGEFDKIKDMTAEAVALVKKIRG